MLSAMEGGCHDTQGNFHVDTPLFRLAMVLFDEFERVLSSFSTLAFVSSRSIYWWVIRRQLRSTFARK